MNSATGTTIEPSQEVLGGLFRRKPQAPKLTTEEKIKYIRENIDKVVGSGDSGLKLVAGEGVTTNNVYALLTNELPEVIYSVVLGSDNSGFNLYDDNKYYQRINNYLNTTARMLGGYAAEELIFGKGNISNGSSSDLSKATKQLMQLFKECGFVDNKLGKYVDSKLLSSDFYES